MRTLIIDKTKQDRSIALKMKIGHGFMGTLLYLLGKAEIFIGLWHYDQTLLAILFIIWTFLLLVFRVLSEVKIFKYIEGKTNDS